LLTSIQLEHDVCKTAPWWARAEIVAALEETAIEEAKKTRLLNDRLADSVSDVAIAAAVQISQSGTRLKTKHTNIQNAAARVLEAFNRLPTGTVQICGITRYFRSLLAEEPPEFDWRLALGRRYRQAERHAVWCRALSQTNITAWV